jgi:hypothetical protein
MTVKTAVPVAIGLIGAGRIGTSHAGIIAERVPGARLAAVADPRPETAEAWPIATARAPSKANTVIATTIPYPAGPRSRHSHVCLGREKHQDSRDDRDRADGDPQRQGKNLADGCFFGLSIAEQRAGVGASSQATPRRSSQWLRGRPSRTST